MLHHYSFSSVSNTLDLATPAQGKVRAGYFKGFETLVTNRGGDPRKILEHHDLDPMIFADADNDIDCVSMVALLEHASHSLKEPLFGMHLAELQDPEVFGCVMALSRAAPTLRQALQSLIDYVPLSASPECEMEMVSTLQLTELRWRAHHGLGDTGQVNYHGAVIIMKTLKMLAQGDFRPRYVNLTLRASRREIQYLEQRLGCPVNSRASSNAIAFPTAALDRSIASANRTLYGLLSQGLAQLRVASTGGLIEQVESTVRKAMFKGDANLDECARMVGTSRRVLQKRLSDLGVKFSDIVQNERIKFAKHALRCTSQSLDDIAFQLGYAEQTSFGRAFKRVTGMTPKQFRRSEGCSG